MILSHGQNLTLRPMKYPQFYEMFRAAIKNTWTVDEVDFSTDVADLRNKLTSSERHMVSRLVAFFATGDSLVGNNLALNIYQAVNSPEARMYLSRQMYEEALHVQFYLTLLDTYVPDIAERNAAFNAVKDIPSIATKAQFMAKWMNQTSKSDTAQLLNIICFAACVEGLFFFAAFAYVFYLRSRGLLSGLAAGTSWVMRDESMHMNAAFELVHIIRAEQPSLFNTDLERQVRAMMADALDAEMAFAMDLLGGGIPGLSARDMATFLNYTANQRLLNLGFAPTNPMIKNPLTFMELQDVQELTNFFERRVSAYQHGVTGVVCFDEEF